jgi:DNA-binding MarR family transcriptional regulator
MSSQDIRRSENIVAQLRRHEFPEEWGRELDDVDGDTVLLMFWLDTLSRRVQAAHQEEVRNEGLSTSEAKLLWHLLLSGPPYKQSPTSINQNLELTSGGVTKTVDRLESQGLVERQPNGLDGRSIQVALTRAGRHTAKRVARNFARRYEELVGPLDPEQRKQGVRTLRTLLDAFGDKL